MPPREVDAGENPWDKIAELWSDPEWRPSPDNTVQATLGKKACPDPAEGRCGPRAAAELKAKWLEAKAKFAR